MENNFILTNQSLTKELAYAYCLSILNKELSKIGIEINSITINDFLLNSFLLETHSSQRANPLKELKTLFTAFQPIPNYQKRFLVTSGQKIKSIPTEQVAYFMTEGRYSKLVTKSNEKYLIDQSLEHLEQKIDPNLFYRVNRQALVSFNAIDQMIVWSKSRVKLALQPACESDIIVSIDKSSEFKRWLNR